MRREKSGFTGLRVAGKELCRYSQSSGEPLHGLKPVWTVHEESLSGGVEDLGRGGEGLGVFPGHSLI